MSELPLQVDINHADSETLLGLPGIGEELAERIISRRPFRSPEELQEVPGIGPKAIERLRPHLRFSQATEPELPKNAPEGPKAADGKGADRRPPPGTRAGETGVWRPSLIWICLGTGLASIILSVVLSLAILAGINGTLSVERNESVRRLEQRTAAAESKLDELLASIDSMEIRLQAVEGLSGRMTTLENEFIDIRDEMDAARAEIDRVQSSLSTLSEQVGSLESRVSVFDAFLRGIQRILQEILPEQPMEVLP